MAEKPNQFRQHPAAIFPNNENPAGGRSEQIPELSGPEDVYRREAVFLQTMQVFVVTLPCKRNFMITHGTTIRDLRPPRQPRTGKTILMALGGPSAAAPPPQQWDDVIAVDSGGDFLFRHGIAARLVIGDLDSISPEGLAFHQAQGAQTRRFPADKDQTDFELGLGELPAGRANQIHLCGVWGGRLDHALMNLLVLRWFSEKGLFTFDTGEGCGGVIGPGKLNIGGLTPETPVALIALSGAKRLSSTGVRWPLREGSLRLGEGKGISNFTTSPSWNLELREGCLLWLIRGMDRAGVGIGWHPAKDQIPGPLEGGQDPEEG